jgi:hypothetical protein
MGKHYAGNEAESVCAKCDPPFGDDKRNWGLCHEHYRLHCGTCLEPSVVVVHQHYSLGGRVSDAQCAVHAMTWLDSTGEAMKSVEGFEPIERAAPWIPDGVSRADFY